MPTSVMQALSASPCRRGERAAEPGEGKLEEAPAKGRRCSARWARLIAKVFSGRRAAIRSGTYEVPLGGVPDGLTQWEVTLAELLSARGYATGMWGNWHYGVNWWASAQWKLGLSYGDADLDRSGLRGNTKLWLYRVQWLW